MASEKVTAMIEEVKALSVLELSELVHALEEAFGVSAAAAAVAAAKEGGSHMLDGMYRGSVHDRLAVWGGHAQVEHEYFDYARSKYQALGMPDTMPAKRPVKAE